MKFFSAALAAFAFGSVLAAPAAPVVDTRSTVPASCGDCGDKPDVGIPPLPLPVPDPHPCHGKSCVPAPLPCTSGHCTPTDHVDVDAIVGVVIDVVVTLEAKVKAHLELIASIVSKGDIDVHVLLKALISLRADLKELKDAVPTLDGVVIHPDIVAAADLELILQLTVRVRAIIAMADDCLKALVGLKADVLLAIDVDLRACLDLVISLGDSIVHLVVTITADVDVSLIHGDVVPKINSNLDDISKVSNDAKSLLSGLEVHHQ